MTNREIDALVAEHVMGLTGLIQASDGTLLIKDGTKPLEWPLRNYSTNIADAWDVVEELKAMFQFIEVSVEKDGYSVTCYLETKDRDYKHLPYFNIRSVSAPMAICLAALKAKGVEV